MARADARRSQTRPSREQYFMLLAVATRERANCLRRHVGAVLVADQRIIATGYNGTPTGFPNCDEGGCHRCSNPDSYAEGRGYDICICVHAEQNAVLQAAKLGYSVQGVQRKEPGLQLELGQRRCLSGRARRQRPFFLVALMTGDGDLHPDPFGILRPDLEPLPSSLRLHEPTFEACTGTPYARCRGCLALPGSPSCSRSAQRLPTLAQPPPTPSWTRRRRSWRRSVTRCRH